MSTPVTLSHMFISTPFIFIHSWEPGLRVSKNCKKGKGLRKSPLNLLVSLLDPNLKQAQGGVRRSVKLDENGILYIRLNCTFYYPKKSRMEKLWEMPVMWEEMSL